MYMLFISDTHLDVREPDRTQTLLAFLKEKAMKADALYILGDFFEFWIGDDDQNEFNQKIIESIRALSDNGVQVYFMPGNRDFLVGKRCIEAIGGILLNDPSIISVYGENVLLSHGDILCVDDYGYKCFRKIIRSAWVRGLFLLLPLKWRRALAARIRTYSESSKKNKEAKTQAIFHIQQSMVEKLMRNCSANYLIHGHFHRMDVNHYDFKEKTVTRIALGDWQQNHGSYLIFEPSYIAKNSEDGFVFDLREYIARY